MEFSLAGPDKLKVLLSAQDLRELGLDYQSLNYSDEATRKILLDLLSQGRLRAGFLPKRSKLYIEIYPREEGGCVIYYTRLSGGEVCLKGQFMPGPSPVAFAFEDAGALLDACAKTHALYRHRILCSALYLLGREYRLIIYPLDYNDNLSVVFLSEYGKLVGQGGILAAYIEEHGELIHEPNALEVLAEIESAGDE